MIQVSETDKLIFNLKLLQIDYNDQKKEELRREIAEKYRLPLRNVIVNFSPITRDENGEAVVLASNITSDIQDPSFQLHLFEDYIKLRGIEGINFNEIISIDKAVNEYVNLDDSRKNKTYKLKYLKWDNYLSYGRGNYYDFTNLHGLVLLNGQPENQCGKTSFSIDLLRFALFGKSEKVSTLDSVFNVYLPEETEVVVEVGLEIEGTDYVIRRTITRPPLPKRTEKSKCRQKVEYFQLTNDRYEIINNCEGESTQETNNIIRASIGSIDDYNLIVSATAYTLADLLHIGQTDRSKLFSRWLGLLTIEEKEEIAKEIWKKKVQANLLSNSYNKAVLEEDVKAQKNNFENNNKQINSLDETLNGIAAHLVELDKERTGYLLGYKETKGHVENVDVNTVEKKIVTLQNELTKRRGEMARYKDEYKEVRNASYDEDAYNAEKETINSINVRQTELRTLINLLKEDDKRIDRLLSEGTCPTCGHIVDVKEQESFKKINQTKKDSYIAEGVANKTLLSEAQSKIEVMEKAHGALTTKQHLELRMVALKSNIELIKSQIGELERKKCEFEENKESIRINNELSIKLRNLDVTISSETKRKENTIRNIEYLKHENKDILHKIDEEKKIIDTLIKEEDIIRSWKVYLQMLGKDGIVKIVIKEALPIINNEIRRLLSDICDFDVEIRLSEENRICVELVRDGKRLDLGLAASGYETTMASIALRSALCSISNLSHPNFCTMDEIIGPIGVSNYDNLHELLLRVSENYQFILHISHVESVWDWHNAQITVYKEGNVSKLG